MNGSRDILVIKLSALGDFIQSFAAFERIRAAHPGDRITLLTTPPFGDLARASPFFDRVDTDGRPAGMAGAVALIARLRRLRPRLVYDLQGNDRTNFLFQALRPSPPLWSGVAFGCALPHRNPLRMQMHTLERQAQQLHDAGIWPDAPTTPGSAPSPDVSWMTGFEPTTPPGPFTEAQPFALLVPGAAPLRPAKRWPVSLYADLANRLMTMQVAVKLIGGPAESELGRVIEAAAPGVTNLIGQTDFPAIAALGARAALTVGNDTGPVHLIAAVGAPTVALFSSTSDPALCAPRGRVTVLQEPELKDLPVDAVWAAALAAMENQSTPPVDRAINLGPGL